MSDTLRVKGALLKYSLLNMLLWAEFCCIFSYTTVFLLGRGLSNSEIGITVALGNLLAVAIQPFLASFADSGKIAIHKLLMVLFGAMLVLFGLAAAFTNILLSAAVFAGLSIFIQNAPGFLNSLGMYYQNHGASMNYGVARGMGSLAFSGAAALMGVMVRQSGVEIILFIGMGLAALMIAGLLLMPTPTHPQEESQASETAQPENASGSYLDFIRENPRFMTLAVGMSLIFVMHQIENAFAIQIAEHAGGDSASMGMMVAIAGLSEVPMMWLYSRIEEKSSSAKLLILSAIGFSVKAAVTLLAGNMMLLYVAYALQCIGFALYTPASVSYADERFGERDKNKAQGLVVMVSTIGGVIGSLMGGWLIDFSGVEMMLLVGTAVSILGSIVAVLGVTPPKKQETPVMGACEKEG